MMSNDKYRNTGNYNTGNSNTGDMNAGHCNTGHCNTGHHNAGNWNTGHCNTGYHNTGHCNTGSFNFGNWNVGFFNVEEPRKINVFDKEFKITRSEFYREYSPILRIVSGTLNEADRMRARQNFKNLTITEKGIIKTLPNFNAAKFFKCTGLNIFS